MAVKSLSAPISDTLAVVRLLAVRDGLGDLICMVPPERQLLVDSIIRPLESVLHELGWESPSESWDDDGEFPLE